MLESDRKEEKENIVFSGGGVFGFSYVGVLKALSKQQSLGRVKRYAGNSIGSAFAVFAALRYSAEELEKVVQDLDVKQIAPEDFKSFTKSKNIFRNEVTDISKVIAFLDGENGDYGINDGNYFESWVDDIICEKVGKKHATFSDVASNPEFAEVYVAASNLSKSKPALFSAETTPDVVVSRAIRASISVPIFFDVVKINDEIYVDGGIYDNFPFYIFNDYPFNKTLGITFAPNDLFASSNEFGWKKYLIQILMCTFVAQGHYIHSYTNNMLRTVVIQGIGISSLDFSLTNDQKQQLQERGYQDTQAWFSK